MRATNRHLTPPATGIDSTPHPDPLPVRGGEGKKAPREDTRPTGSRHNRVESERFKSFTYEERVKRDKVNLDIFWLKDDALEESAPLKVGEPLGRIQLEKHQHLLLPDTTGILSKF